jgi:hypothetical protein
MNSVMLITKTVIQLRPLIRRKGNIKPMIYHRGIPLSIPPEVIKRIGKIMLSKRIANIIIAS